MCDDKEILVNEVELTLLKKVFEASSDLLNARYRPEFRRERGMENLIKSHEQATFRLEGWYEANATE